ncbi:sensor histidine kinase [Halocalculus aciditolerans]|uniref:histidine kinase n=1 Tax=Halocalculus aciditolerans TaxID=1383812 RepID=A0A830FEF5_9EURY|nr:HAMP domain-containing sensor histidine kinase [Halocalculus aciditolerans]GGL66986.1 hypothetical protein GCM10009039_26210 [Halocalculus aciditolerans]
MQTSPSLRPQHGFAALGCVCLAFSVYHVLTEGEGLGTLLESLLVAGLSVIVLYTAWEVPNRPASTRGRWRAFSLAVAVSVSFTLLAFAVWVTWRIEGDSGEFVFLLTFAASLGAAVGSRSALYAVESTERLRQARELTKLLRINQRVMRHNIRNELAIALGYLENIESGGSDVDVAESTRVIRTHLERLVETTDRARRIVTIWEDDTPVELDLQTLVREEVEAVEAEYPDAEIDVDAPEPCRVIAHPALALALREAVENAVEHNPPKTPVSVSLRAEGETVVVEITDQGSGIPAADIEAIHLPEETSLSHGAGLGLWLIYWTVEMSDGAVDFEDNDPSGSVVRLTLPRAPAALSVSSLASVFAG